MTDPECGWHCPMSWRLRLNTMGQRKRSPEHQHSRLCFLINSDVSKQPYTLRHHGQECHFPTILGCPLKPWAKVTFLPIVPCHVACHSDSRDTHRQTVPVLCCRSKPGQLIQTMSLRRQLWMNWSRRVESSERKKRGQRAAVPRHGGKVMRGCSSKVAVCKPRKGGPPQTYPTWDLQVPGLLDNGWCCLCHPACEILSR